ncbi:RTA1-domain-containing protein [Trametopsis cervina]|nr:RTA1-domain-containing protein [Trametopsis cervina]
MLSVKNYTGLDNRWLAISISLFTLLSPVVASDTVDPKNDPRNPLKYLTTNSLTTVGVVLMVAMFVTHTVFLIKSKAKYMLVLVIAEACYGIGIATRYGLHYLPDNIILYSASTLFTTLSPCGFIAAEYVILGRLVQWLKAEKHLLIRPSRVTAVFVCSDVITFLVQGSGGGISASARENVSMAQLGSHVFFAGLILQLISFSLFTVMLIVFLLRMRTKERATWSRDADYGLPWHKDWRSFAFAMFFSCIGVLVRSVYRTIELSQGYTGHLTTTEIYFWVLDFIPLYVALLAYVPFWPGRFINRDAPAQHGIPVGPSTPDLGDRHYEERAQSIPLYVRK